MTKPSQTFSPLLTRAERQELYTFVLTRLHEDAVYIPLTFETNKALYTSDLKGVHFGTDQYDVDFASMYFACLVSKGRFQGSGPHAGSIK